MNSKSTIDLSKNEHTYPVSAEFQQFWGELCNVPYEASMHKMLAWRTWVHQSKKFLKIMRSSEITTAIAEARNDINMVVELDHPLEEYPVIVEEV